MEWLAGFLLFLSNVWKSGVVEHRLIEASTLLFIAWQVFAIRSQTELDHERSRREKALDSLKWFVGCLRPEHHRIAYVLDNASDEALRSLYRGEAMTFHKDFLPHVKRILSSRISEEKLDIVEVDANRFQIDSVATTALRSITITYLNLIEMALAPMIAGVADEDIIKSQMRPYFINADGTPRMLRVREIWTKPSLPASFEFNDALLAEQKNVTRLPMLTVMKKRLSRK